MIVCFAAITLSSAIARPALVFISRPDLVKLKFVSGEASYIGDPDLDRGLDWCSDDELGLNVIMVKVVYIHRHTNHCLGAVYGNWNPPAEVGAVDAMPWAPLASCLSLASTASSSAAESPWSLDMISTVRPVTILVGV